MIILSCSVKFSKKKTKFSNFYLEQRENGGNLSDFSRLQKSCGNFERFEKWVNVRNEPPVIVVQFGEPEFKNCSNSSLNYLLFFLWTGPGFVFSVQKFIHAISVLQKTIGHLIKRTPSDWGSLKNKNLFFKTKWIKVKKTFVSIKGSRCFIVRLSRKSSRSTSDLRNLRTIFLSFSITSSTSNVCRPDRTDLNYDLLTFSWKFTYQL